MHIEVDLLVQCVWSSRSFPGAPDQQASATNNTTSHTLKLKASYDIWNGNFSKGIEWLAWSYSGMSARKFQHPSCLKSDFLMNRIFSPSSGLRVRISIAVRTHVRPDLDITRRHGIGWPILSLLFHYTLLPNLHYITISEPILELDTPSLSSQNIWPCMVVWPLTAVRVC